VKLRTEQPTKTDKTQKTKNTHKQNGPQWNQSELWCSVRVNSSCLLQYTCRVIHGHARM